MVMFFDGKLYTSPLNEKEIKNAIDIGTGTGKLINLGRHLFPLLNFTDHLYVQESGPCKTDLSGSWIDLRLLTSYFSYNSDFADDHPNCNVIGTDISLIQPSWVPPNASFEINDASKKWTYQENYFDFIHIRWLTGVINDWDSLYKEAYRCCKPGSWIEQLDCDAEFFALME
ncbi:hypothetical protein SMAC4_13785 [Sordaria macrospora]|uniref:uncharacterized protein n=1 Tax=Sordaria macrospora TaxID=5147 RepID=UPI002B27F354|nr:hypothetical protein SMAC4_13785 [Sordaria macrospora]